MCNYVNWIEKETHSAHLASKNTVLCSEKIVRINSLCNWTLITSQQKVYYNKIQLLTSLVNRSIVNQLNQLPVCQTYCHCYCQFDIMSMQVHMKQLV